MQGNPPPSFPKGGEGRGGEGRGRGAFSK